MPLIAKPLGAWVPIAWVGAVALTSLPALRGILAVCFVAGVRARSRPAKKLYQAIDSGLLAIPGYDFVKACTGPMKMEEDAARSLKPVQSGFDDNAQLGLEVERLEDNRVFVFLPGAPDPWSGSMAYFSADRIRILDVGVKRQSKACAGPVTAVAPFCMTYRKTFMAMIAHT